MKEFWIGLAVGGVLGGGGIGYLVYRYYYKLIDAGKEALAALNKTETVVKKIL